MVIVKRVAMGSIYSGELKCLHCLFLCGYASFIVMFLQIQYIHVFYLHENSFVKKYNGEALPLYFKDLESIFGTKVVDGMNALGGGGITSNRHGLQDTQSPSYDTNQGNADTPPDHTPGTSVPMVDLGVEKGSNSSSSDGALSSGS
ncbi:hypothetical protein AMTR_s00074p00160750 [Amborella trichopoda]|uniref:Uncharacterized protein n=1 Tax=Amborella trichopoda TaxID=13333 RepID=W1NM55_AMBTC|nr:hypothetical protein AMTR_s00074p00160750 [Amborella trichopoda]